MKWRYRIAIGFGVVILLIITGSAVLFQTQAGLSWAASIAQSTSDGALSIERIQGTLAGPIEIDNLTLELDDALISVAHAKLDWSPWALLAGKLHITQLTADHIIVSTKPDPPQQPDVPFKLPEQLELSWHWIVDTAQLHAIDISTAQSSVTLSQLGFCLDASEAQIKLSNVLEVNNRFKFSGQIRLEPHGDWKIAAKIKEHLSLPDYPPLTGSSQLDGALHGAVSFAQKISTPFTATLEARIKQLLDQPVVQGNLDLAGLNPGKLRDDWPDLTATAAINFHGSTKSLNARGTLAAHGDTSAKVGFDLQAALKNQQLHIAHLNLDLLAIKTAAFAPSPGSRIAPTGQLSLHGTVGLNAPHALRIESAWHDLSWPPGALNPEVVLSEGSANLDGTLDDWSVHALSQVKLGELPAGSWLLDGHGNPQEIVITGLAGRWLNGRVLATGSLSLDNEQAFKINLRARNLDFNLIPTTAQLAHNVGFNLNAQGALGPLSARVKLDQVTGQIRNQTITGHADLAWSDQRLVVNQFELAAGPNHLTLQGHWGKQPDIVWQLQAPELSLFAAELGGHLNAKGTVTGTRQAPHFEAKLSGEALHWRSIRIKQAEAQASFKPGETPMASLDLTLKNLSKGASTLGDLTFSLSGPSNAQHFKLHIQSEHGELSLAGSGKLLENAWRGTLQQGRLKTVNTPTFTLQSPAEIVLGKKQLKLAQSCWQSGDQSGLCLAGSSNKTGWQVALKLHSLPLALANPFLDGMRLRGELDGHLEAQGGNGELRVLGMVHAGSGSVNRNIQGKNASFKFNEAGLEIRINDDIAQARLGVLPALGGMLDIHAKIPWRKHETPTGRIDITAHLPNLSNVDALSTAINKLSGRLDAKFSISGSLDKPLFSGQIALSRASFTLPRLGTRVENAQLTLGGDGPQLTLSGSMDDGKKGHLTLHGRLIRNALKWGLDLSVKGEHFLIADIPMARLIVSPDLNISLENRRLKVNGDIAIPSANITQADFANAIKPTADLVIVGTNTARQKSPIAVQARITLRLGEDVHFEGFGLKAKLGGQLTLIQEPHELTTASGEIRILKGHYKAYGISLNVTQGALLFSGGWVANPSLNLRAQRKVGYVIVGLYVTGSLRKPHMDIYSDPPMSESNALAYLLFGHGVRQNSGSETSLQAQAANALGIAGATFLAKSIGKHIGVDTISVENASRYSTDSNQASLFLGEYLTPRLYVSYGIGLYEPINLFRIRYTLSRHWALEAESGTISGADILFHIAF